MKDGQTETKPVEVKEAAITPPNSEGINIDKLITDAVNNKTAVGTVERIFALRNQLKAEWAKEQFDTAMAGFQAECPIISKTKEVTTRSGKVAYKYAPIEVLDRQTKSLREKYGFSYTTNQSTFVDPNGDRQVRAVVTVTHKFGHSEDTEMTVPLGNKTDVMSQTQVVAAAYTFAKRYAFKNAFGIIEVDEDDEEVLQEIDTPAADLSDDIIEQISKVDEEQALVDLCRQLVEKHPDDREAIEDAYRIRKNELEKIAEEAKKNA